MKKKDIINLIRYHADNNEAGFRNTAYKIAKEFDEQNEGQLAEYIMALLSKDDSLVPQEEDDITSSHFEKLSLQSESLFLPDVIVKDLIGIVHAINRRVGIHKFLFQGAPGTGKTEAVKQLGRIMKRDVYMVNFSVLVDSRLGQTQKNLNMILREINSISSSDKVLILFDEVDAIALDRTNPNDVREMGRVTSEFLRLLDRIKKDITLIATTNLFQYFDNAIIRRFDAVIDFDRYSNDDLCAIAENILNGYLPNFKSANRNIRLFRKIVHAADALPMPGDLKNSIRSSLAFSNPLDGNDYFRRLFAALYGEIPNDVKKLKSMGFTVREIEILTKIPKSSVDRKLKVVDLTDA